MADNKITAPILLDSTGVAIKDALVAINNTLNSEDFNAGGGGGASSAEVQLLQRDVNDIKVILNGEEPAVGEEDPEGDPGLIAKVTAASTAADTALNRANTVNTNLSGKILTLENQVSNGYTGEKNSASFNFAGLLTRVSILEDMAGVDGSGEAPDFSGGYNPSVVTDRNTNGPVRKYNLYTDGGYTEAQVKNMIRYGNFTGIWPGDFINVTINNENMDVIVAGLDTRYKQVNNGDASLSTGFGYTNKHHVEMFTRHCLAYMGNVYAYGSGGYQAVTTGWKSSNFWKTHLPTVKGHVTTTFPGGDTHLGIVPRREWISTANTCKKDGNETVTAGEYVDSYVNLLREWEIFGAKSYGVDADFKTELKYQLPLFALSTEYRIAKNGMTGSNAYYWEQDVSSYSHSGGLSYWCLVNTGGGAYYSYLDATFGFRPRFLIG